MTGKLKADCKFININDPRMYHFIILFVMNEQMNTFFIDEGQLFLTILIPLQYTPTCLPSPQLFV